MTEVPAAVTENEPAAETLKRAYGWGNPTKGWLYFLLGMTTVLLLAGVASVSREGIPNGLGLAMVLWLIALVPAFACGPRFPWSKTPSAEWAPPGTPAAVGGLVALGVSTVATAIQAEDEVILNISVVGIFLSGVLLSLGWHGDSKLQDATAEVTAKTALLAERETTIASLNEKITAKTALLAERETTIAILNEKITAKNTLLAEKDTTIASLNEKVSKTADTIPAVTSSLEAVFRRARRVVGMLGLGRK